MLYFDNQPKQYYGTIRQQIWSALHFPFHIGIVLVVEGAQQVVMAYYILRNFVQFDKEITDICFTKNLDGMELTDALTSIVHRYAFTENPKARKSYV
jgi:hypothetical protein